MVLDERTLNALRVMFPIPELSLALCFALALSDAGRFSAGFLDDLGKTFLFEFLVLGMVLVVVIISNVVRDDRRNAFSLILLGLLFGVSFALVYGGVLGIWFPFLNAVALTGKEMGESLTRHTPSTAAANHDETVIGALFHRLMPRMVLWFALIFVFLASDGGTSTGAALVEGTMAS